MKSSEQNSLLKSTAVLTAGTILVKILGALFKIPLTNLLGGSGMANFNVAYEAYLPLYALFVSGIPAAVSRQVSGQLGLGNENAANRLLSISLKLFGVLGLCGSVGMFFLAEPFAALVHNPQGALAVKALSPALFLGSLTACFRGLGQGHGQMSPTAVSQTVEALGKLVLGLGAVTAVRIYAVRRFEQGRAVFGGFYKDLTSMHNGLLPVYGAAAIFGITLSILCGTLYLWYCTPVPERTHFSANAVYSDMHLGKSLLMMAAPICLASAVSNLTSFLDLISVTAQLTRLVSRQEDYLRTLYAAMIPPGLTAEQLPSYLYGSYSGLAAPVFNLVPALTTALGTGVIPFISYAFAGGNRAAQREHSQRALLYGAVISFPAGLGLMMMASPILTLLYPGRPMEAALTAPCLSLMGVGAIFVGISLPVNAALQAVGKPSVPMKLLMLGGVIKLVCNYCLVSNPRWNIHGAPAGTVACYFVVAAGGLMYLSEACGGLDLWNTLCKPCAAGAACALGAKWANSFLLGLLPSAVSTVLALFAGGFIYICCLFFFKIIKIEDLFLFFQRKI